MNTNATGPPPPPPMALGDALQHTADYLYMRNTTVMATVPGYITSALMIGMDAILVARTWAIYGRSRTVLTILVLGGCLCYIPAMVVFNVEMSKQGITPADAIRLTALMQVKESFMGGANATLTMPIIGADAVWVLDTCFMVEGTKKLGIMFVMSLVYESILFTAMMFQFVRYGTSSSKILENLYHESFYFVALKSIMCSRVMLRLRASFAARDAVIDGYHFDIRSGEAAFGNANSDSGVNGVVSEARFAKFVTTMTMTITTTNGILGGEVDEEAWNLGETPAAGASGTIRVTRRHELDWTADDALEPIATPSSRSRSMDEQLSLCRQRTVDETDSGTWLTRARPSSLPIIQVRNPPPTRKRPRSVSTVS
ncbi:hypothetical protein FRB96_005985 [Tulasnella sp. 330]|nr:hypothetical protein FRB96_005985 [Tulasnella sp. 330]KAG8887727.1 hypothetical protein FRB98_009111 [Tulasnella sp. 332]